MGTPCSKRRRFETAMLLPQTLAVLLACVVLVQGNSAPGFRQRPEAARFRAEDEPQVPKPTCLVPQALQSASALTGQENGTAGISTGQARSQT